MTLALMGEKAESSYIRDPEGKVDLSNTYPAPVNLSMYLKSSMNSVSNAFSSDTSVAEYAVLGVSKVISKIK